jgi:hypothetical protein
VNEITLGQAVVTPLRQKRERLTMLLWGKPACGKTVFAATAPGKKLWLLFDPNGTASIRKRDDILVVDLSTYPLNKLQDFRQGTSFERDLVQLIRDQKIDTVVLDSLTSFSQLALEYAIKHPTSSGREFKSSLEKPGLAAYGTRSSTIIAMCMMVEMAARSNNAHLIFIAHDKDEYNDKGEVEEITISLRGQASEAVPPRISEIWRIEDEGKQRWIYVRNHGKFKPMRTRMFATPDGNTRMRLTYDQDTQQGTTLEALYQAWEANGFDKLTLPAG